MRNKKWLALLLCLLLCFALVACDTGGGDTTPTPTPTNSSGQEDPELQYFKAGDTYRLYHWWLASGQEDEEFRDSSVISQYRANTMDTLEAEYGIKFKFIAWTGSYWDEVRSTAFTGSPMADGMHGGSVGDCINHYWYEESPGSCLSAISDYDISFNDESYWDTEQQDMYCTFNGKLYGFVMNQVGMKSIETAKVTFMNYDLMEQAGYSPSDLYQMVKDKTWNWDVFEDICSKVNDPDRSIWGTTHWDLGMQFALSNGGEIISSSTGSTTDDTFTGSSDACIKGWDFLIKLYNAGYTCPIDKGTSDADAISVFKNGQTAFMINHWRRTFDNDAGTLEKYGWLPVPMGPDATDYSAEVGLGECFVIFKNCTNPNGLLKAMKMLYRPMLARGSEENDQLFSSEIGQYCRDEESAEFLSYLETITKQNRAIYYALNWDYMGMETTTAILSGDVSPSTYFESVAPVYNDKIAQILRSNK